MHLSLWLLKLPGVLRVNGRLDYERQHNVTLIAQAFDNGSPSLQNTTTVFINIININDNTPVFNQVLMIPWTYDGVSVEVFMQLFHLRYMK